MKSEWRIKSSDDEIAKNFSIVLDLDYYLSVILSTRDIKNINDAYRFIKPRLSHLHSPYLMKGMTEAVERIKIAVDNDEQIGLFADSDLDGLTSLAVLYKMLNKIGLKKKPFVRYPVNDEDYGLTKKIIDEYYGNSVKLLVTLDSGIRDVDEISHARELGIDVIVCDHHEQGEMIPDSIIINPKQKACPYPFKELAGVGVTFKLCHAILIRYLQRYNKRFVLIAKDGSRFFVSYIKNRVVERIVEFETVEELSRADINLNDTILLYDSDLTFNDIEKYFPERIIGDLVTLIEISSNKSKLSILDVCEFYSINRKVFNRKIDLANEIFLEYDLALSPKLLEFIDSIIDLIAIGTVADIMPLRNENRTIVHYGIKSLNSTMHPGLKLLSKNTKYRAKDIAWNIAPVLNTPGRYGQTGLAADFFLEDNTDTLKGLLNDINRLNEKRKQKLLELHDSLFESIQNGKFRYGNNLIFVVDENIPEGLCGLLANRLSDTFNVPVIAVSLFSGKNIVKGSGRVKGSFDFLSCVEPISHMFERIGGHAQAFGFSVGVEKLEEVREGILKMIDGRVDPEDKQELNIDVEIPVDVISDIFFKEISRFEPFGKMNEEIVFLSRDVAIRDFSRFGSGKNHGKYLLNGNYSVEAIGWNIADKMEDMLSKDKVDLVYRLDSNEFNGITSLRMIILDID